MVEFLQHYLGNDLQAAGLIVLNLIIIESLLSIDNAAVLATMVMDLPKEQRARALRIGIICAYIFRGLCLIFASYLIGIWWLQTLGGLYLFYIAVRYFITKATPQKEDDLLNKQENYIYKITKGKISYFWSTVILVETMDLAFSIDNVFAAVAFTSNIYLVCTGVFIGILTMRLFAGVFVKLLEKYPFLEKSAFIILLFLGIKLMLTAVDKFFPGNSFVHAVESETGDFYFSMLTVGIFIIPILTSILFDVPKRNKQPLE
ncbi:MAG: DUF475 domain-containing protein [Saprospiraceae bacterium]|nr:DUF475 domain-containing protein [Saprospiraceae bacterium]